MRAAAGPTPVKVQFVLQTFGSLVQQWRAAGGLRGLLLHARAKEDLVDIFLDLFREYGRKRCTDTFQHAFPQGQVAANEVQYEYSWYSRRQEERKEDSMTHKLDEFV